MIDPRAMHSANSGVYDRFSQATETASVEYLKGRGEARDRDKYRAWTQQVKDAKAKKSTEESSPAATSATSTPSPSTSTPAKPSPGRKFTSAAPRQDRPNNFGRAGGSYSKTPGQVSLGGFDRPNIFAGKGTNQPDVSKAAVSRNVPPTPNPWAGKTTIAVTTTHKVGDDGSSFVPVHAGTPSPSSSPAAAPQGWAARTGQSLVSKASSIEQKRNGSGRRAGFAGGSSSHLSS